MLFFTSGSVTLLTLHMVIAPANQENKERRPQSRCFYPVSLQETDIPQHDPTPLNTGTLTI